MAAHSEMAYEGRYIMAKYHKERYIENAEKKKKEAAIRDKYGRTYHPPIRTASGVRFGYFA